MKLKHYLDYLLNHQWTKTLLKLKEFIVLIGIFIAFGGGPFNKPDVEVTYEVVDLIESFLAGSYTHSQPALTSLPDSILSYLGSENLILINIKNNSSSALKDVELKVNKISKFNTLGIRTTSSRLMLEREKIFEVLYEESASSVTFPNFEEISPKAMIDIIIWGKIDPLYFKDRVEFVSSADSQDVTQQAKASDLAVFFANYVAYFCFALVAIALMVGLKRKVQE